MQQPISLLFIACFALAGCGVFKASEAWTTVRAVRVNTRGESDPSAAYAARLSERLNAANIEHQVVTYQFRYRTRLNEEGIATRTAVVYRDEVNPRYPWWLMDERLSQPFWLPSGDLAHQISFYIRTPVELVETAGGTRDGSGKTITGSGNGHANIASAPTAHSGSAVAFRGAPARITPREAAANSVDRKRAWLQSRLARNPAPEAEVGSSASASFRALHGTAFDPQSTVDRQKMERMRGGGGGVARAY